MSARFGYDVIIAGGGPAGASAAIHLTNAGARVLLVEQKKFPREKLCGEFISPECALHFRKLGVERQIINAQPAKLTETVFYSAAGKSVRVPSSWFRSANAALGLSRAEMDERLLRRAAEAGAEVLEHTAVTGVIRENSIVRGVVTKHDGMEMRYRAAVTIDATGRARAVARHLERRDGLERQRATLVAFKAHLDNTRVASGACEIYFYRGGYGGLSTIEEGRSNLCFITAARDVRRLHGDPERTMREVVCRNSRAAHTLAVANATSPWLAVSLESFGRHPLEPAKGLLTIGDAASFIDPFTGSGMLMALESGELISSVLADHLDELGDDSVLATIGRCYRSVYRQKFAARLRLCSTLRRAAFVPGLAGLAIAFFGSSNFIRRGVTMATRYGS